jgi:cytochrome c peroxidase
MRRRQWALWAGAPFLLGLLAGAGCERARPDREASPTTAPGTAPGTAPAERPAAPASLDPRLQWDDPLPRADLPIEFVHQGSDPGVWDKLPKFWNAPPPLTRPDQAATLTGLSPLISTALAAGHPVKIKVPLGLDDPGLYVPASNPPTLHKWELGRRLFFDPTWLEGKHGRSCANCHGPETGFAGTAKLERGGFKPPTLINCVYNRYQFWDGRATLLEEVVQRTLEDESVSDKPGPFRHVWGGVIGRLRADSSYRDQFESTLGCPPTQDAVGRALATYLRTLLAGDSVHDRALQARGLRRGARLEAADYLKVLDAKALKGLGRAKDKPEDVAAELVRGHELFQGKAGCARCHSGSQFTDQRFHNLGVGWTSDYQSGEGKETGRFTTVPIGAKEAKLIAAYKTPTLRGLSRTAPYQHNGGLSSLRQVVEFYNRGGTYNQFLDPLLLNEKIREVQRELGLAKDEVDALILFLNALGGEVVDPSVASQPPAATK